jgi:hypothetical protein
MTTAQRIKLIWWGDRQAEEHDPRVTHQIEELKPYAALRVLLGLVIILVGLPALVLPSAVGVIPYDYPQGFIQSPAALRYLICLLGSVFTFLSIKPPWDLPFPQVVGTDWQVGVAVLFLVMAYAGVKLVRNGWKCSRSNLATIRRLDGNV